MKLISTKRSKFKIKLFIIQCTRPKKYNISLTDDQLKMLKSVMRKKQTMKTVRNRCQILIDLDEAHGKILTHVQSAETNCVCMATITNTVKLYSKKGIEGIISLNCNVNSDNARRKLDRRAEARIIEISAAGRTGKNSA